jgi:hypothetical protein
MGTIAFGDGSFITSTERGGLLQSDPLVTLNLHLGAIPELQISGPRFRQYQIEYSDAFPATNGWSSLGTFTVTNHPALITDWSGTNTTQRLYRAASIALTAGLPGPVSALLMHLSQGPAVNRSSPDSMVATVPPEIRIVSPR